jgi:hypothetical protein
MNSQREYQNVQRCYKQEPIVLYYDSRKQEQVPKRGLVGPKPMNSAVEETTIKPVSRSDINFVMG